MRTLPLLFLLGACDPANPSASSVVDPGPDDSTVVLDTVSAPALRAEAISAYLAKDFATATDKFQAALNADPDSTVDLYNLACGYALLGNREAAIESLTALLERGVDYGAATDPDFDSLRGDPAFDALVVAFANLAPTVHTSERVAAIGDRLDLAAEGMAYDPATGRFFVGSMRTGQIWVATGEGGATEFARLAIGSAPVSAFGLEVDAARGALWAVGSGFSLHESYTPKHQGKTALFEFDLQTGALRSVYSLPGRHPRLGFNDLAVAADGSVYLSGGDLYVLRPGAAVPELVGLHPALGSSNGITIGPDPATLYVSADREGIARVDLQAKTWSWLSAPEGVDLRNFDGLYWAGDGLVGIQLGLSRWRAVRVDLHGSGRAVTGLSVLEQGAEDIAYATTGDVAEGSFYYLARSPLPPGTDRSAVGPAAGQAVVWKTSLQSPSPR